MKRSLTPSPLRSIFQSVVVLLMLTAMLAQTLRSYGQTTTAGYDGVDENGFILGGQSLELGTSVEELNRQFQESLAASRSEQAVAPFPTIFDPNVQSRSLIVQRGAFGMGWFQTGIEQAVEAALLTAHGLTPTDLDRSRLMLWERSTVRAALWNRLIEIIKKTPAQRTASEQAADNVVALAVKTARIACAQLSLNYYQTWKFDPSTFVPPAPFTTVALQLPGSSQQSRPAAPTA